MEQAVHEERMRRETLAAEISRKRTLPANEIPQQLDAKRVKLEHSTTAANGPDALAAYLANFDFSTLPVGLVADLVIANLQSLSEQSLHNAIDVSSFLLFPSSCYRFYLGIPSGESMRSAPSRGTTSCSGPSPNNTSCRSSRGNCACHKRRACRSIADGYGGRPS